MLLKPYFQAERAESIASGRSAAPKLIPKPQEIDGTYIYHRKPGKSWQQTWTFAGERWLDCTNGPCRWTGIQLRRMRLEEKAAALENAIVARHDRHGMVTGVRLERPGDLRSSQTMSDDNDGLWTAMYAVAKLYEYRSTEAKPALERAERAIRAVLFLEKVTGLAGYPARSYIRRGERKPEDGRWVKTADGEMEWKSDTSSDEIVGHFYMFAEAWDLLPEGDLRRDVQATCARMMDRILRAGYHLKDETGEPTRWGKWSPEYFATPGGRPDSPLNAAELLSFLRTAAHVTGDRKYDREFDKVAQELGYLQIAQEVSQRQEEINYSDEELAMLSFLPWLKYEKDPQVRRGIGVALEQWFVNMRREKNPLWNSIYEVGWKKDRGLRADSIATLERIPLDLVTWRVENSKRGGLPRAGGGERFGRPETTVLLPPDERAVMKWNGNPFVLDGGDGGRHEEAGTFFLLPYWMGRYYGLWREE